MVFYCVAYGCNNSYNKGNNNKRFFRFPSDPKLCKAWVAAVRRMNFCPSENSRICSDHFIEGKPNRTKTHPDYVPTKFVFKKHTISDEKKLNRYYRAQARRENKSMVTLNSQQQQMQTREVDEIPVSEPAQEDRELSPVPILDEFNEHTATAEAGLSIAAQSNEDMQAEIERLKAENTTLKNALKNTEKRLQRSIKDACSVRRENLNLRIEVSKMNKKLATRAFDSEKLTDNNCKFYTGVKTVAIFLWIVSMVSDILPKLHSVSYKDQVLMVLMKFRLGLLDQDIANRFNVAPSTVSKIMSHTIPALATRLKFLIRWPSKIQIRRTLPRCFRKKFKKCRVVIDCSEIFIQRPQNLNTRGKTYSNYKHHNTLKFLVGITPYGSVSYVSKCWGGRISDKELCARSGFYDMLQPGDLIMADRGFTIAEELGFRGARLAIPAFTKRRNQLPGRLVNSGRVLSRARIHVERLIGQIKKFRILQGTLSFNQVKRASDIVLICCSLVNLNKSQVS